MNLADINDATVFSQRFWDQVDSSGDCWLWTGRRNGTGYGLVIVSTDHARAMSAHRAAYLLTYGAVPDNRIVCHHCDNRLCVQPDHLFIATQKENIQDMVTKGRHKCTPLPGEKNPKAKLSADQVEAIRARYHSGESQTALGRAFGVSQLAIARIVRGLGWTAGADGCGYPSQVGEILHRLPPHEQRILQLRLGLGGIEPQSSNKAAEAFRIRPETVRRIEEKLDTEIRAIQAAIAQARSEGRSGEGGTLPISNGGQADHTRSAERMQQWKSRL